MSALIWNKEFLKEIVKPIGLLALSIRIRTGYYTFGSGEIVNSMNVRNNIYQCCSSKGKGLKAV